MIRLDNGRLLIDPHARRVHLQGQPLRLGTRAFDLLCALATQPGRVVPKAELLDRVWPGLVVEENNLQVQVMALRRLLGGAAIATASGQGYQLTLSPDASADAAERDLPEDPLVGRGELLLDLHTRLRAGARLLLLCGPGGSGKTRLAQRLAAGWSGPVWVALLAPARDEAAFWAVIAAVLGVQESGSVALPELVRGYLAERRALLVLDNLEHLPAAGAAITTLLQAAPALQIVGTSRARLRDAAEASCEVPPLADTDALVLLQRRAAEAGRPLAGAADADAAALIVRRLEGLPLAIELAAARLRVLSPAALAARLEQRLPLLKASRAGAPARQQTLRDTLAWSHELLAPGVRELFRRLGLFVGGWSLDAAEAVDTDAAGTIDRLEALIDLHLVFRLDDVEAQPRYGMLETIREYAVEQLEQAPEPEQARLRDHHAAWFRTRAAEAAPHITSAGRAPWLAQLRADLPNHRAATRWSQQRGDAGLLAHVAALTWLWYFDGLYHEGRAAIDAALALPGGGDADRAAALSGASRLAGFAGDMAIAHGLAQRSAALWRSVGDARGLGLALWHDGVPALFVAGRAAAVEVLGEAIDSFSVAGDAWGVAVATAYRGIVCAVQPGDEDRAAGWLNEGLARCQALGDDWAASTCSGYLGLIAMRRGHFGEARRLYEHIDGSARATGDRFRIGRTAHFLGELDMRQGRPAEALPRFVESLLLTVEQGREGDLPLLLCCVARALTGLGRPADAARLFAAGARPPTVKPTLPQDDPAQVAAALALCRAALNPPDFEAAWRRGELEPATSSVAFVRTLQDARFVS